MHKTKLTDILERLQTKIQVFSTRILLVVVLLSGLFVFTSLTTEAVQPGIQEYSNRLSNSAVGVVDPVYCVAELRNSDDSQPYPCYVQQNGTYYLFADCSTSLRRLDPSDNRETRRKTTTCGVSLGTQSEEPTVTQLTQSQTDTDSQQEEERQNSGVTLQDSVFTISVGSRFGGSVEAKCNTQEEICVLEEDGSIFTGCTSATNFQGGGQAQTSTGIICKNSTGLTYTDESSPTLAQIQAQANAADTGVSAEAEAARTDRRNRQSTNGLTEVIIDLIAAIFAIIIWGFAQIISFVFWLIANAFLVIVRINPASAEFIQVAIAPWNIVVNLANIVILGSFIFVGLGYIVGLDAVRKKKSTASDFLISIVIIAVSINFTLSGAATVINVVQGVGDLMYASYIQRFGAEDRGLIENTLSNLRDVSTVQCAGPGGNSCAQTQESRLAVIGEAWDAVIGGDSAVPILIRQAIYLIVMLYAIFIFIKALRLALFRAVGLWLLMITSPLALVMYLSPVNGLKTQAYKWFSLFWQMTIFYPAFLFAVIVVNSLAGSFSAATQSIAEETISGNYLGGVSANAVFIDPNDVNRIVLTVLGGIVAVFTLQVVIDFFEKGFGSIASAALNGVTSGIGTLMRGTGALARATGTVAQATGVNKVIAQPFAAGTSKARNAAENLRTQAFGKRFRAMRAREQKLKDARANTNDPTRQAAIDSKLAQLQARRQREKEKLSKSLEGKTKDRVENADFTQWTSNASKWIDNAANYVEASDDILKAAGALPAGYFANLQKGRQAKVARALEGVKGGIEKGVRTNKPLYNALKATGYTIDADPNLNRFAGLDPDTLNELEKDFRKENKGKSYIDSEIEKRQSDVYKRTLGLKEEYDREVKDILLKSYDKKIANGQTLSDKEKTLARKLIENSLDDPGLAGFIQSSGGLTDLARESYTRFDTKTQEKINEKFPSLLNTSNDRYEAGARVAGNPEADRELNGINFQDPDFLKGYLSVKGDDPKVLEAIQKRSPGAVSGFSTLGDSKAKNSEEVGRYVNRLSEEEKNIYEEGNRRVLERGFTPQNEVISQIARINADETKNDAQKEAAIESTWEKTDNRFFGKGVITRDPANGSLSLNSIALDALSYDELKKTEIGADIDSKQLQNSTLTENQKAKILRTNIARAATNHALNAENYQRTIDATSRSFKNTISEVRGKTAILNTETKALDDLASQGNAQAALQSGGLTGNTFRTLGMQKEFEKLEESFTVDGKATYVDGSGRNRDYDLSNLSQKDRNLALGDINKVIAAEIGGDTDPDSNKAYAEALGRINGGRYGDDAKDLLNEQLQNRGSAFYTKMESSGQKRADVLLQEIQKNTERDAAGNYLYTEADTNSVLRGQIANNKKKKQEITKDAKGKYAKTSLGDIDNALKGIDQDAYRRSNVVASMAANVDPNAPLQTVPDLNSLVNGDTQELGSNLSNTAQGYALEDTARLNEQFEMTTADGNRSFVTRENVVRDYLSGNRQYQYTPEFVEAYDLDHYTIGNDDQVYTDQKDARRLANGNYDFAEAQRRSNLTAQDALRQLNPQAYQQAQDLGMIESNQPVSTPRMPWEQPNGGVPDRVGQYQDNLNNERENLVSRDTQELVANLNTSDSQNQSNSPQDNTEIISETRQELQSKYQQKKEERARKLADAEQALAERRPELERVRTNYEAAQNLVQEEKVKLDNDSEYQTLLRERESINNNEFTLPEEQYNPFTAEEQMEKRASEIDEVVRKKEQAYNSAQANLSNESWSYKVEQNRFKEEERKYKELQASNVPKRPKQMSGKERVEAFDEQVSQNEKMIPYEFQNPRTQQAIKNNKMESIGDIRRSVATKESQYQTALQEQEAVRRNIARLQERVDQTTGTDARSQAKRNMFAAELQRAQAQEARLNRQTSTAQQEFTSENRRLTEARAQRDLRRNTQAGANTGRTAEFKNEQLDRQAAAKNQQKFEQVARDRQQQLTQEAQQRQRQAQEEQARRQARQQRLQEREVARKQIDISGANIPTAAYNVVSSEVATANVQKYVQRQQELAQTGKSNVEFNDLNQEQRRAVAQGKRLTVDQEEDLVQTQDARLNRLRTQQEQIGQASSDIKANQDSARGRTGRFKGSFSRLGGNQARNQELDQAKQGYQEIQQLTENVPVPTNDLEAQIQANNEQIAAAARKGEREVTTQRNNPNNRVRSVEHKQAKIAQSRIDKAQQQNAELIDRESDVLSRQNLNLQARKARKLQIEARQAAAGIDSANPNQTPPDPEPIQPQFQNLVDSSNYGVSNTNTSPSPTVIRGVASNPQTRESLDKTFIAPARNSNQTSRQSTSQKSRPAPLPTEESSEAIKAKIQARRAQRRNSEDNSDDSNGNNPDDDGGTVVSSGDRKPGGGGGTGDNRPPITGGNQNRNSGSGLDRRRSSSNEETETIRDSISNITLDSDFSSPQSLSTKNLRQEIAKDPDLEGDVSRQSFNQEKTKTNPPNQNKVKSKRISTASSDLISKTAKEVPARKNLVQPPLPTNQNNKDKNNRDLLSTNPVPKTSSDFDGLTNGGFSSKKVGGSNPVAVKPQTSSNFETSFYQSLSPKAQARFDTQSSEKQAEIFRDAAQGGRESEGLMQKKIDNTKAALGRFQKADAQINKTQKQADAKVQAAYKTTGKAGVRGVKNSAKAYQKVADASAKGLNVTPEVVPTGTRSELETYVTPDQQKKIQQNYAQNVETAKESTRELKAGKTQDKDQLDQSRRTKDIKQNLRQNKNTYAEVEKNVAQKQAELDTRKAAKQARNNPEKPVETSSSASVTASQSANNFWQEVETGQNNQPARPKKEQNTSISSAESSSAPVSAQVRANQREAQFRENLNPKAKARFEAQPQEKQAEIIKDVRQGGRDSLVKQATRIKNSERSLDQLKQAQQTTRTAGLAGKAEIEEVVKQREFHGPGGAYEKEAKNIANQYQTAVKENQKTQDVLEQIDTSPTVFSPEQTAAVRQDSQQVEKHAQNVAATAKQGRVEQNEYGMNIPSQKVYEASSRNSYRTRQMEETLVVEKEKYAQRKAAKAQRNSVNKGSDYLDNDLTNTVKENTNRNESKAKKKPSVKENKPISKPKPQPKINSNLPTPSNRRQTEPDASLPAAVISDSSAGNSVAVDFSTAKKTGVQSKAELQGRQAAVNTGVKTAATAKTREAVSKVNSPSKPATPESNPRRGNNPTPKPQRVSRNKSSEENIAAFDARQQARAENMRTKGVDKEKIDEATRSYNQQDEKTQKSIKRGGERSERSLEKEIDQDYSALGVFDATIKQAEQDHRNIREVRPNSDSTLDEIETRKNETFDILDQNSVRNTQAAQSLRYSDHYDNSDVINRKAAAKAFEQINEQNQHIQEESFYNTNSIERVREAENEIDNNFESLRNIKNKAYQNYQAKGDELWDKRQNRGNTVTTAPINSQDNDLESDDSQQNNN